MSSSPEAAEKRRNYVVVSTDTHAAPSSFEQYLSYVDPKYRDDIESYGAVDLALNRSEFGGVDPGHIDDLDPIRAAAMKKAAGMSIDTEAAKEWFALYTKDLIFADDADGKRVMALESLGIHGEVTYPNPHLTGMLPNVTGSFTSAKRSGPLELLWPALTGYNRWLADFCNAQPGRRAGVIQLSLHDMDRSIQEIKWAREGGIFGGISLPPMTVESGLPGYADAYYEPLWSACEEYDMVVNIHTGAGATDTAQLYDKVNGGRLGLYEVFLFSRRPLWFLVLGGVFDRHPKLKVVIAENGLQWFPSLIRDLELIYNGHGGSPIRATLKRSPGEYFREHIWLGGSVMQRHEADMRDEIGLDRMMWGSDYPHLEGAPPVHREVLSFVLGGLPEADLRAILGNNALSLWDFDRDKLQEAADRVGPTVADLAEPIDLGDIQKAFGWSVPRHIPVKRQVAAAR